VGRARPSWKAGQPAGYESRAAPSAVVLSALGFQPCPTGERRGRNPDGPLL